MRALWRRFRLWFRYGRSDLWWPAAPKWRHTIDRRPNRDGREFVGIVLDDPWGRILPPEELVELFLWADREYRKVGK